MPKRSDHFARRRPAHGALALLTLSLERQGAETLGRQLYLQIRERILNGRLAPGARLPSTRRLAEELSISRTVPLNAYAQLAAEGYLEGRRGSGQYVRELGAAIATGSRKAWTATRARTPIAHSGSVPFDSGSFDAALFPHAVWAKLLARGWRREGFAAAGNVEAAGLPALREAIARYLFGLRGIVCTPEQVIVTSGNDDALQLIVRALTPERRVGGVQAWMEDPGYAVARRTLMREGLRVVPVPVDEEGIDVGAGRALAPAARLAIVTPSRQYPLGVALSLPRRLALLAWARQAGALIIEDEYDSEIRFAGRPLTSLMSLDSSGAVVAVGSFSKLTFPGLRVGYIVAPERLAQLIVAVRAQQSGPMPVCAQPALAEFIEGGLLASHLRTLRREVTRKRNVLTEALGAHIGGQICIPRQEVGINLTVT
ncbi:MAG TPA: PLP-dependent aminotransferase family protein, partial [Steroidobacteraceae bacterium]|nr:PLP-dependent aminotransferase family protein [Steroidobacteraceae bacterium]